MKRNITVGTVSVSDKEIEAVMDTLKSTYVTMGKKVEEFENKIAKLHGKKHGVMVNSGQSGLEVALKTMIDNGTVSIDDTVLVPAITYSSTINAVINSGLKPRLYDINPKTLQPNINNADINMSKLVIPVHYLGMSTERPDNLGKMAVLEDACESSFGYRVGYGDITCLSFFASHSISTFEGGMCLTDDTDLDKIMRSIRYHGRDLDSKKHFAYKRIGGSNKPTDIAASMGLAQLERNDELEAKRIHNYTRLYEGLKDLPIHLWSPENNKCFMFPMLLDYEDSKHRITTNKDSFVKYLNDNTIGYRDFLPITNQEAYKNYFDNETLEDKFPGAKVLNDSGLYIGTHTDLTDTDTDYVIEKIRGYFER